MPFDNQIEPPPSFMDMYATAGSRRPNAPQEVVLARYELCEDMACMLTEQAQTLVDKESLSEQEVLRRCHQGLLKDAAVLSEKEAAWVIHRLAEQLAWAPLVFDPD